MFSFGAVFMNVGGCDAHDDDRTGPLHETEEEEDRAKGRGRSAIAKLECHCVLRCACALSVQKNVSYVRKSWLMCVCVERLMLFD